MEKLFHFFSRLEIIFLVSQSITVTTSTAYWGRLFFTIAHAQQNIVGVRIFLIYIENVVGGNGFYVMLLCKSNQRAVHAVFIFLIVAHQFEIEIICKLFFPPNQCFFGLVFTDI